MPILDWMCGPNIRQVQKGNSCTEEHRLVLCLDEPYGACMPVFILKPDDIQARRQGGNIYLVWERRDIVKLQQGLPEDIDNR